MSGLAGACPAVHFAIGTTRVVASATTRFDDGSCSRIVNGVVVEVKGKRQGDGSVSASAIQVEETEPEPKKVELSGTMSGRAGACPVLTFTVQSKTVVTSASTEFHETACGALANGDRVEVKGTGQSNGSVLASRVEKKK